MFSANYYQQLTSPNVPAPGNATFGLNLQVRFGDRLEGVSIVRPHPITIYDLQADLQQRFNIPILEQHVTYNGMSITLYPPDAPLESIGVANNSFISLWYRNAGPNPQMQQQAPPAAFYGDGSLSSRGTGGYTDTSSR